MIGFMTMVRDELVTMFSTMTGNNAALAKILDDVANGMLHEMSKLRDLPPADREQFDRKAAALVGWLLDSIAPLRESAEDLHASIARMQQLFRVGGSA